MCTVSMIFDHYRERWNPPGYWPVPPQTVPLPQIIQTEPTISQEEIAEFRRLLERARKYDADHNQPDCEMEEKRAALLAIAKALGVEIEVRNAIDGTVNP